VLARVAVLFTCAAVGLAACGSGDEDEVRAAVDRLYAGFADKDAKQVCGSLTAKQRRTVTEGAAGTSQRTKPRSCEQVMSLALEFVGNALKDADKAEVTDVQVDGEKAKATVEFKGKSGDLGLAKESDQWKVDDFDLSKL
jgi:hypothetical protein